MTTHSIVDAVVPAEWIGTFIGHQIWSRPESMPGKQATWCDLVNVWEEIDPRQDADYPFHFLAWIRWGDRCHMTRLAKMVYVHGLPQAACVESDNIKNLWKWIPPIDDPPPVDQHPVGCQPKQTIVETPTTVAPSLTPTGQLALFTF